jgi:Ni,Fe-hydrogenase maturation factor
MSIASNRKPKMLSRKTNTVVIGVGNAYSGDDDAGLVAAQRLAQLASDGAMILTETGDAARLIEFWQGANKVIILECPTQAITLTE